MPSSQSRRFFAILMALSALLLAMLFRPVAEILLFAAVIATATYPVYLWLVRALGGRRTLGAVLIVVSFTLLVIIPLTYIGARLVRGTILAVTTISATVKDQGVEGLFARAPEPLRRRLDAYVHPTPEEEYRIQEQITGLASRAVSAAASFLSDAGRIVASTILALLAVIVLLIHGPSLLIWLERASPLENGQTREILTEFRATTSSVLVANVGTSLVQSAVALVGFLIARMPQPGLATLVTFIASFIPGIGGATAVALASGIVFLTGEHWRALFLLVWGLAVVGVVDNLVKPLFIKHGVELNGAVVFFAILAGLAAFGPSGLILGPLVVMFFVTLVRIYERDYKLPAPPAPTHTSDTPDEEAAREEGSPLEH